jgi:single-strand DNA-binding protein
MYDNSVRLIGFLGQNAEKHTAPNKTPYVILNLATTVRWRDKESQKYVERTEWHRLIACGNLARFAGTLKGGNHISAEGELRYRMISDKDHHKVQSRLADIHLAKISKLDRSEQLTDGLKQLSKLLPSTEQPRAFK